jgi:hypothetical protein
LAQVIQQIKPERCQQNDPGPMEKICLQINTLVQNSQSRVDAIERQEQERKQEMERKKQESNQMLATAKKRLKTAPANTHCQKSNAGAIGMETGSIIVGSPPTVPVVVVKEVERDRAENNQLSPGNKHKPGTNGGVSPKTMHKKSSTGEVHVNKLGGSSASLDESFEMLLNTMENSSGGKPSRPASCIDIIDGRKKADGDAVQDEEIQEQGKQGRSATLSEGMDVERLVAENAQENEMSTAPIIVSNSLPILSIVESSIAKEKAILSEETKKEEMPKVIPRPPRLPPNLIATIAPATLEAREKVLAMLKEKVPRIDIGPASNDED